MGEAPRFGTSGLRGLVTAVENRALRPSSNLYLVATPTGQGVAGNVGSLEPGIIDRTGWAETRYRRLEEADFAEHQALVRVTQLSGGFRLLVGRDLEERRRVFGVVASAAQWSFLVVIVLGLGGGVLVARWSLRRSCQLPSRSFRRLADRYQRASATPASLD